MKTMNEITLYDLMAEELSVIVLRNEKFGFDLYFENEEGEKIMNEDGVHPCAADSFAYFCASYLAAYEKAKGLRP